MNGTQFFQKQTAKLPPFWKLALLRCIIYSLVVGWGTYRAGVNGFDNWSDITPKEKVELEGDTATAMFGVLLAFLDTTLSKVNPPPPPNQPPTPT